MALKIKTVYEILGISNRPTSHAEKMISAIGGFLGILGIFMISLSTVGSYSAAIIVASMGATAVLLFAVPHSPLSQPWPLFGGHIVSAIIGVTCAKYITNDVLAASMAVGIAIGAMYYLECIHPPGGATALSAVIGGESVTALGYQYVITPILLNVAIIFLVSILFNSLFHWRRYPTFLHNKLRKKDSSSNELATNITHEDFVYALSKIDSYIDINEDDLLHIYDLILKKTQEHSLAPDTLVTGGYYSNGAHGDAWSIRLIIDESKNENQVNDNDMVIYKIVAGNGKRSSGYSSRKDFLRWAKHQVVRDEKNWKRIDDSSTIQS